MLEVGYFIDALKEARYFIAARFCMRFCWNI